MRNKTIALTVGLTCHSMFAVAILLMAYALFGGLTQGFLPLGQHGRVINIFLLLQFPLFHSFLLSKTGRRILESPFPREIARDLSSTTFSLFSSLQLILVFLFWTPDREIWFAPTGGLLAAWTLLYAGSWVLLIVALSEAGMAMHTGLLGWWAILRGIKPQYPKPSSKGLHSSCRHPIYFAFLLIILTAPVWSFDHFVLALVWVAYCLIGPLFKERRQRKIFGIEVTAQKKNMPYIIPRFPLGKARTGSHIGACEKN